MLPAALDPVVWGTETSATAEAIPLRTSPVRAERGSQAVFSWATSDPPVGARYRLEWRFRSRPGDDSKEHPELRTAADRMKAAGIIQDGDPVLRRQAVPFRLPDEADEAEAVIAGLFGALQRAGEQHVFSKGMGVAAPQIGISRAAAVVIPPDPGAEPVVMLNPQVISESAETDEQYEGCLSFFDVRGLVPRPLHIEVACARPGGQQYILALDDAMARLAAHGELGAAGKDMRWAGEGNPLERAAGALSLAEVSIGWPRQPVLLPTSPYRGCRRRAGTSRTGR